MTAANPKYPMLVNSKENRELFYNDDCDKYDYLTAVACGAIGGVVDIFLVGAPGDSVLGKWTDAQTDNAVISFAKKMGWKPNISFTSGLISIRGRGRGSRVSCNFTCSRWFV